MTACSTQATWSLSEWLSYIEAQHSRSIDLGLARVAGIARRLALTEPAPRSVLVAGTNGKGTTVAVLEQVLLAAGQRTATYCSPHLFHYSERVRIDGQPLSDALHCAAFAQIEQARGETPLTYFEFGTLAALWLIKQAQVDVAIIEVGLGGRLDATNVIEPTVSAVTSVGIDHIDFLGDDIEQIGFEKAGVFRRGCVAIGGAADLPQTVARHACSIGADYRQLGRDYAYRAASSASWSWRSSARCYEQLPVPNVPLQNAATALAVLEALAPEVTAQAVTQGLMQVSVPGRMQPLQQQPLVIADVGHNPHAARYLATQLAQYQGQPIRAVCGMLADKDIDATLAELKDCVDHWYLADLHTARGAQAVQLAQALEDSVSVQQFASVAAAIECALAQAVDDDVVIVFGSFYTVADALAVYRESARFGE